MMMKQGFSGPSIVKQANNVQGIKYNFCMFVYVVYLPLTLFTVNIKS